MKTIITHVFPDLDAVAACWLIKRFLPDWEDATIGFVPAGSTFENKDPDQDSNVMHVDTGLGQFDHHQTDEYTSATYRVFSFLVKNSYIRNDALPPLERLAQYVTDIDHFDEVNYPDPTSDRYEFLLSEIIDGLNVVVKDKNKTIECIFMSLDAIFLLFKNKIKAQEDMKNGYSFRSKWGKSLAMETKTEGSIKFALKSGYQLVIRKDPDKGNVRIKTLPDKKLNLTPLCEKLKEADPKATWFLHSSKNMLLNGSSKAPKAIPTVLSLQKVIEITKEI